MKTGVIALLTLLWPSAPAQTVTVSGTVVDAAGGPVTHAALALLTSGGALPADERLRVAHSVNAAGRFDIANVPAGSYKVVVASAEQLRLWPADAVVARYAERAFPFDLTTAGSTLRFVVDVGPAPAGVISISRVSFSRTEIVGGPGGPPPGAPPRPGQPPSLPPRAMGPGVITGVVRGADGLPLGGVHVQAGRWASTASRATSRLLPISLPVETDSQGTYRLEGLQPGSYVVAALAWRFDLATAGEASRPSTPSVAGSSGQRTGYQTTYFPGVAVASRATDVTVTDGTPVTAIDLMMLRTDVVTFSVRFGQPTPNMRGFGMATLTPESVPDQFSGRNAVRGAASADGLTTFRDVAVGRYALSYYTPSGWVNARVDVTPELESRQEVLEFALREPMTVTGIVDFKPTRVTATPDVFSGMTVTLNLSPMPAGPLLRSPVAPDGSFSIRGVPGGRYTLTLVSGTPWIPVSSLFGEHDSLDAPVDMTASVDGARLVVTDRQTTVQGRVVDDSGAPVTAGSVVVFSTNKAHWTVGATRRVRVATIVPGGGYNLVGLPPGTYHAAAFAPGTRITNASLAAVSPGLIPFELGLGEVKNVPVTLRR